MTLTEHRELRLGDADWDGEPPPRSDPLPPHADVAIVGAGITGATIAARLAADGARVALIDRRPPGRGSTAASTALVMWEMDVPLTRLAERIGMDEAARRWRRVHEAVLRLKARIDADHIDCDAAFRPIVYLDGPLLPDDALIHEGEARRAAGLPSEWLNADTIATRFGVAPRAGLVSGDSFAVDPVRLTFAMLDRARLHGASVTWPCDVAAIDGCTLLTGQGTLTADRIILATGYERPELFLPPAFSLISSFAIATAAGTAPLWREDAMIWEAADPYLYCRTDAEGRIVAGGEDETSGEGPRDRMIGTKAGTIVAKLGSLLGGKDIAVERRWAATFGVSPDGLPAIGRARHRDNLWLASGFGGNGISFAALAAELLAAGFDGSPDPSAACFDPYRFD